jgi:hypothetical protein
MTQTPNNPYGNPYETGSEQGSTPYESDPYATPADPYTAPADPYASSTDTNLYPSGDVYPETPSGVVTPEPVDYAYETPAPSGTSEVAKGEAGAVKDTAKDEAANVKDTAAQEAGAVKDTAVQAGQQVAGVAKEEAKNVVAETATQAKDLFRQAASEVSGQAGQQQQKVAGLLHSYAKELGSMASSSNESGPLTDLAHQASRKGGEIAHWLEDKEPGDVLDELRSFARRRPVAFLVGAAVAGVLAGRFTRGLAADAKDEANTTPGQLTAGPVTTAPSASLVEDPYAQTGRYGDLASDDQVIGYDSPTVPNPAAGTTTSTTGGWTQ